MKSTANWMVLALALALPGCKEKKESTDIITTKTVKTEKKGTQVTGNYKQDLEVNWGDKPYTIIMERTADSTLAMVDDGAGNLYYDNRITVTVKRDNGSVFFNRTFTKNDFAAHLSGEAKKGALLGIVYDCVTDNAIRFAASIGSPDKMSDEYMPFVLTISRTGTVSISNDTLRDTPDESGHDDGEDEGDEEDGA